MSKVPLKQRVNAALATVAAVFTGKCVHQFATARVGVTQHRKGYRVGVKSRTAVAEQCIHCGVARGVWVHN